MPQRFERRRQAGLGRRLRRLVDQHHGGAERDRHQHRHPVERAAPRDLAERAADQRADRDAEAEGGLVEHDGAREAARRRRDDDREGGRDEQRVADAPAGPELDDLADRARRARQPGEHHDQDQPGDHRRFGADPARHPVGEQHRDRGDHEVRREQERGLARRGVQLVGDRGQDGVDQPDPHERHDAGEGHREHGLGLLERAGGGSVGGAHRVVLLSAVCCGPGRRRGGRRPARRARAGRRRGRPGGRG